MLCAPRTLSHKTIYIDIDEEITSIIDRLKKSREAEVIIVAPKRALLLQSLVNLRLLKRESDRKRRRLIIVTQDKLGKKLIEKAGIKSAGKPEGEVLINDTENINAPFPEKIPVSPGLSDEQTELGRDIGSTFFYGEKIEKPVVIEKKNEIAKKINEIMPVNKIGDQKTKNKSVRMSDILPESKKKTPSRRNIPSSAKEQVRKAAPATKNIPAPLNRDAIIIREDNTKESEKNPFLTDNFVKKTEAYFNRSSIFGRSRKEKKILDTKKVKGTASRYFLFFLAIFIIASIGFFSYNYLPKAAINIYPANSQKAVSQKIQAVASIKSVDKTNGIIPASLVEFTEEKVLEYKATGSKSGKGNSSGKVTIYNEYSTEDQTLVATTRLKTPDGKIFRIIKSVVVPGMKKTGSNISPGSVDVEVSADQPGQEYDIGPASFTIPGFEGSPKYQKFYAKSLTNMTGGASNEARVVSAQDMQRAKENMTSQIKKEMAEIMIQKIRNDEKLFEDTIKTEITSITPSASIGSSADNFTLKASVKLSALAVNKNDIAEIIYGTQDANNLAMINQEDLNYVINEYDLEKNTVSFDVKGDISENPEIDVDNFKRGILGKSVDSAYAYAKNYPAISKIEIQMRPYFFKKIPLSENRIEINVLR